MIKQDDRIGLNPPQDDTIIWRYMSMTKFLMLLDNQGLWFSRSDTFEDANEGMFPQKDIEGFVKRHRYETEKFVSSIEKDKKRAYISCWIQEDHELFLMWKSYVKDLSDGVALKTTIGKLIKALSIDTKYKVYCSNVEYIDFNEDYCPCFSPEGNLNALNYYYIKDKCFKQENELRLLCHISEISDEFGFYHPISVHELIESVYLSPKANNSVKQFVSETLKSHNLNIPVCDSEIKLK